MIQGVIDPVEKAKPAVAAIQRTASIDDDFSRSPSNSVLSGPTNKIPVLWIHFILIWIRIRGSICWWNSGSDLKVFFSVKNLILQTRIILLFMSWLSICIKEQSDFFLKIIWYYYNFGRFFKCYPDPHRIRFIVLWRGPGSWSSQMKWTVNVTYSQFSFYFFTGKYWRHFFIRKGRNILQQV